MEPPDPQPDPPSAPAPAPAPAITFPSLYVLFRVFAADMRAEGSVRAAWDADAYADRLAQLSGYVTPPPLAGLYTETETETETEQRRMLRYG